LSLVHNRILKKKNSTGDPRAQCVALLHKPPVRGNNRPLPKVEEALAAPLHFDLREQQSSISNSSSSSPRLGLDPEPLLPSSSSNSTIRMPGEKSIPQACRAKMGLELGIPP